MVEPVILGNYLLFFSKQICTLLHIGWHTFLTTVTVRNIPFLATVALAFGLLSLGHLIFNNIIDRCCITFM